MEMEEVALIHPLCFWLLARLPGVRSCVGIVVAASRHLEVAMLQVVRQSGLNEYSVSYLELAAEHFWCSVSLDCEPCVDRKEEGDGVYSCSR